MKKLGKMIDSALGRESILRSGRGQRAIRSWNKVVGEAMALRSSPERVERGVVWVAVEGSAWAQELRMAKDKILARLNELAGEPIFLDVRFGVRPVQKNGKTGLSSAEIAQFRASIEDMSIREIAERRLREWPDEGAS